MKKILSAILAAAMLIAMLPVAFATEGEATEFTGYKYVFTSEAFPDSFKTEQDNGKYYVEMDELNTMNFTTPGSGNATIASDPWKVASSHTIKGAASRPNAGLDGATIYEGLNVWISPGDSSPVFAIALKVEKAGKYCPELNYFPTPGGPRFDVFLAKEGAALIYTNESSKPSYSSADWGEKGFKNGANSLELYRYAESISDQDVTANEAKGIYILKRGFEMAMTTESYQHGIPMTEGFGDKLLTLESDKIYYLIFRYKKYDNETRKDNIQAALDSFSLIPVQDEKLTEAFKPDDSVTAEDYSEPAVISITKDGNKIESVKNSDGTHNITAPEKNKAGAKFLYWAKGLSSQKRIIIGATNELKNYVPDAKYANYLIPVYEDEVSGTEYYNANGQLIPDAKESDRPSMAGYGTATGWDGYGNSGIRVAHYDLAKPEKNIDVTVTNGTGTGKYAFGDTVTCTANGTGTFKCWTKSKIHGATEEAPEIVSVDETYKFKAWENCTVTAVYEDHHYTGNKMKIIIDTFDVATGVTGVMAEFIGLDNAVEKGIMFTDSNNKTTKIAMTTKDNQFTVIADEAGTYEGYAIIKNTDDNGYTLITDGEYTKSAEAE